MHSILKLKQKLLKKAKTDFDAVYNEVVEVKTNTAVSVDGTDVKTDKKWALQSDHNTLNTAMTTNKAIRDAAGKTAKEINDARIQLAIARAAFENASKDGLMK